MLFPVISKLYNLEIFGSHEGTLADKALISPQNYGSIYS